MLAETPNTKKKETAEYEKLARAKIERERTVIGLQIEATDRQIDGLLYGLTKEEIAIVEDRDGTRSTKEE